MTIVQYEYDSKQFLCQWFAGDKVEDDYFPPDSLQLVVKPHKKGTVKYRDL